MAMTPEIQAIVSRLSELVGCIAHDADRSPREALDLIERLAALKAAPTSDGGCAAERARIEIIQEDREAAWPFRPTCYRDAPNPGVRDRWDAGQYDHCGVIKAFAEHRTAFTSQGAEVAGEDPRCPLHGEGTLWAKENPDVCEMAQRLAALAPSAAPVGDLPEAVSDGDIIKFAMQFHDANDRSYGADTRRWVRAVRSALAATPVPASMSCGWMMDAEVREQAIAIVQAQARDLGYMDEDVADIATPDGEDLLAVQSVERALLFATPVPVDAEGFVLVPREPTEAMLRHTSVVWSCCYSDPDAPWEDIREIWSAMLAAAPQAADLQTGE